MPEDKFDVEGSGVKDDVKTKPEKDNLQSIRTRVTKVDLYLILRRSGLAFGGNEGSSR